MPDTTEPSPPLTDDEVRWLLVRTAASLFKLWARLERLQTQPGGDPRRVWVSQDIVPPEPWLDVLPRNVSLSGVERAALLAQGLLIDEAVAIRSPDRRRVCLILQHIQCGSTEWSVHTRRMADTLGIELAATVRDETNGATLHTDIYRLDGTYARHSGRIADLTPKG